jgi:hypothetical protein
VLEVGRYIPVYHTGTFLVPEFYTGIYQYILYRLSFIFIFLVVYPCFAFKKCAVTSEFIFRTLVRGLLIELCPFNILDDVKSVFFFNFCTKIYNFMWRK